MNIPKIEREYQYLYEIPRFSLIRVPIEDESVERSEFIMFHHPDGMYSYCTVDTPEGTKPVHLSITTPLIKRGDHYELYNPVPDRPINQERE